MELVKNETHGNTLQVFNCELGSIRVIVDNGEPLFCLSDLCDVLEIQNKARVKEYIDKEFDYDLPTRYPILDTLGREQQAFFIKEHHLYYGKAYTYVYGEFAKLHCISDKVNMDYLKKNIDHLAEFLAIATTELD